MMFNYFAKPDPSKEVIKFPRGRIDDQLEAYVTRLLEEAGIACFIWGEQYLSIMGSTTGGFLSGYVVPDKDIERAAEILDTADFPPCIQGRGACTLFQEKRTHPYLDYHWHTDHCYAELPPNHYGGGVSCHIRRAVVPEITALLGMA